MWAAVPPRLAILAGRCVCCGMSSRPSILVDIWRRRCSAPLAWALLLGAGCRLSSSAAASGGVRLGHRFPAAASSLDVLVVAWEVTRPLDWPAGHRIGLSARPAALRFRHYVAAFVSGGRDRPDNENENDENDVCGYVGLIPRQHWRRHRGSRHQHCARWRPMAVPEYGRSGLHISIRTYTVHGSNKTT